MVRKRNPWELALTILTALCILACLFTFGRINVKGFVRFCNADVYGDTLVAKLMWEQKTLFPEGWTFGNQFYVIATPAVAALFYGITGNTNTAMVLATELMTVLILVSFYWLLSALTEKPLARLMGLLLLLTANLEPFTDGVLSIYNELFFLEASYYACYLITVFVVCGDYVRTFRGKECRPWSWGLSLLLCFAMGMQSLRQTVSLILPLLAYEAFLAVRRLILHEKLWTKETRRTLLRCLSYAAANVAGAVLMGLLNVPHTTTYGAFALATREQLPEKLATALRGTLNVTHASVVTRGDLPLFFPLYSLCMLELFNVGTHLWLLRVKKPESPLEICWFVSLFGMLGVLLASIVLQYTLRSTYLFTWIPLLVFSMLIMLKRLPKAGRAVLCIILCLLSLGNLHYSYGPVTDAAMDETVWDYQRMCDWAVENGYGYVYGSWGYCAPYIARYSGGKLVAGCWHSDVYQVLGYINPQNIYGEEENARAIYVFLGAGEEERGIALALERGVTLTKVAEFGDLRAYVSPEPLMETKVAPFS